MNEPPNTTLYRDPHRHVAQANLISSNAYGIAGQASSWPRLREAVQPRTRAAVYLSPSRYLL